MWQLSFQEPKGRTPFPLAGSRIRIGRELGCDLLLDDGSVSRHHAELKRSGAGWTIRDLHSTNGVLVNGQNVEAASLQPGDRIQLGVFRLRVEELPRETVSAPPVQATFIRRVRDFTADWGFGGGRDDSPTADAARHTVQGELPGTGQELHEKRQRLDQAYGNRVFGYLIRLAGQLLKAPTVEQVLERVMDLVFEALPGNRGFVLLTDDEGRLVCELMRENDRVIHRPEQTPPISQTILQAVMAERMALVTDDAQSDDRLSTGQSILLHRIRSVMCAPLWSGDDVLGVIQIDTAFRTGAFTEPDLELLTAVANYAAVAVERVRYAEKVEAEIQARSRLARYHSPAVIEAVLAREEDLGDDARGLETGAVTVLFADLVGFTAFSETADPEDVVELLNAYFDRAVDVIFAEGGTLDKFIGDCVMAFFGAPVAVDDHASRGVRAGMGILRETQALNAERRRRNLPTLDVRVAVNSGPVMVGDVGSERRVDYTVLGNTVNVAARLESGVAKPGQVVIGPETRSLVDEDVPLEDLGTFRLKGLESEIRAYRVLTETDVPVPES